MKKPVFGVRILNYGRFASRNSLVEQAKIAERGGYYSVWAAERLVVPDPPNQPWSKISPLCFEELTLLSHISGMTERVKLGTFVLLAPLRNPIILARQATTLDVMSNGRLILGVGLGWMKEEFDVSRVNIHEKGPRTDETIRFLRKLWSEKTPEFHGRFIDLAKSFFEPKPVQGPIPIWIGGESEAALSRAGRLGDGWLSNTISDPAVLKRCAKVIAREARRAHRTSPHPVVVSCMLKLSGKKRFEVNAAIRSIETLVEAGVDHVIVDFEHNSAGEYQEKMSLFAEEVVTSF